MQPYFMPYIGYFQLIKSVDVFVFYDDVNFIKGGWINRNKILINGKENLFTIPLKKASQNLLINQIKINSTDFEKLLETIKRAYIKAPYFHDVYSLVAHVLSKQYASISDLAITSITEVLYYLNIQKEIRISSVNFAETKGQDRAERLIEICKIVGAKKYINPIGGQELYTKQHFLMNKLELNFLKSDIVSYKQFDNDFIPWLSIIDVLMFNSPHEVNTMLDQFQLI